MGSAALGWTCHSDRIRQADGHRSKAGCPSGEAYPVTDLGGLGQVVCSPIWIWSKPRCIERSDSDPLDAPQLQCQWMDGSWADDVVDCALVAQKGNVAVSTPVAEGDEIEMNTELNMEGWDHLVFPPYQLAKRMPDVMEKIRQAVDERGGMLTG